MRIDDNAEALAMMKRALGSLEGKIREAYNKGYQDGVKSLVAEDEPQTDCYFCKWLGDKAVCGRCRNRNLFARADGEPNSSEKPNNCKTKPQTDVKTMSCYGCKHRPMGADICDDPCHCHYEPQVDCTWK